MSRYQLASRFTRNAIGLRSDVPLLDEQIRKVAPSIFASGAHESRSSRYLYIPTIDVLTALKKEGFEPFSVCQTRTRTEGRRDHTKHLIRLRHASQINASTASEICLVNAHDGSASYQMLAGAFRFVCSNGLVCGDISHDIRIRHSGTVIDNVIEGAWKVVDSFESMEGQMGAMKSMTLSDSEQAAFAHAALALRFDTELAPAPITESQILRPRRAEDVRNDLFTTFNRVQENLERGGLQGVNAAKKRITTRAVTGMDQSIKLNRALWLLAERMRELKS